MEFKISHISELSRVAEYLIVQMKHCNTYLLNGDLGAGKTTLVKNWMANLGIKDLVNSPTFSLVNEYRGTDLSIYHMDMYRLKNIEEAIDMGIEEYIFDQKSHCIIEWPGIILDLLTLPYISIDIVANNKSERIIKIKGDLI